MVRPLRSLDGLVDWRTSLPEADQALFAALRAHVCPPVELVAPDLHINDPEFADAIAEALIAELSFT